MICKTIEIRDRGTFIPAMAIKLQPRCDADRYLLARSGYGVHAERQAEYVILMRIDGGEDLKGQCDPNAWGDCPRTMLEAHCWIALHFEDIESGDVVDVEFILGETASAKISERKG